MKLAHVRRHGPFIVVFVLLGLLYFSTIRPGHDWGGDFSVYIAQARQFATGIPYSFVATEESARAHGPGIYPPLTGLVLAPVYAIRGLDYVALKAVLVAFLWLSLPLYYFVFVHRGLPPLAAAWAIAVFGLSSIVLELKDWVVSDSLALFVSGGALLFIETAYRKGWDSSRPVLASAGTVALLFLSYLTRATALCLVLAFVIFEFLRARRIRLYGALTIAAFAVAFVVYGTLIFDPGQQYGSQFQFRPRAYLGNALYYIRAPGAFWGGAPAFVRYLLAAGVLVLSGFAYARRSIRPGVAELYVLIFAALLIAYSSGRGVRYALPILPLVLMYAAEGLLRLLGSRAAVVCAAAVLVMSVFNLRTLEAGVVRVGVAQASFAEVCGFLRNRTPADAVILSWNPRVLALYTDKRSALHPLTDDPHTFDARTPSGGRTFLVVYEGQPQRQRVETVLERSGLRWALVFRNSDFRVYERRPPDFNENRAVPQRDTSPTRRFPADGRPAPKADRPTVRRPASAGGVVRQTL